MRITVLGSGTSTGVPEYKCDCSVCLDATDVNSKNYRTRPSVHLELEGKHLQFDVGPNFIDQINRNRIEWIDAVIYTHCHADHVSGTNDLVMPSRKQQMDMPIYGPEQTIQILEQNFNYMFSKDTFKGGGVAHLLPHVVNQKFQLHNFEIIPIPVEHGTVDTFGYRINNFGYVPDVKHMPDSSLKLLEGIDLLIIDALSFNPNHPTHLGVQQAIDIANHLQPKQAYFTHIMHRLDHRCFHQQCEEQQINLPENIYLAYDRQVIYI